MAAVMVINPVMSHTAISHPALPTFLVISALTMNIPEPIMDPATIIVASSRERLGLKFVVSDICNRLFLAVDL
jgi:hypothetical protein